MIAHCDRCDAVISSSSVILCTLKLYKHGKNCNGGDG